MSYKAEFVSHDLYKQLCQRIHSMNSYGRKKHIDKLNGVDRTNKIYTLQENVSTLSNKSVLPFDA